MSINKQITEILRQKIAGIKTAQDKLELVQIIKALKELEESLTKIINNPLTPPKHKLRCIQEQRKLQESLYNIIYKDIPLTVVKLDDDSSWVKGLLNQSQVEANTAELP